MTSLAHTVLLPDVVTNAKLTAVGSYIKTFKCSWAYLYITVQLWVNPMHSQDDGESGSVGKTRRDHVGDFREGEDTKARLLVAFLEFCTGSLISLTQYTAHSTATFQTRHLGSTGVHS